MLWKSQTPGWGMQFIKQRRWRIWEYQQDQPLELVKKKQHPGSPVDEMILSENKKANILSGWGSPITNPWEALYECENYRYYGLAVLSAKLLGNQHLQILKQESQLNHIGFIVWSCLFHYNISSMGQKQREGKTTILRCMKIHSMHQTIVICARNLYISQCM